MTTHPFTKKAVAIELLKGTGLLAFCFLVFLSFYPGESQHLSKNAADGNAGAAGPEQTLQNGNALYTLYLENRAGSEQLRKLLGDNEKQKMVLQLFRSSDGYIRLMAFPSTNGNGKYFLSDAVELLRSNVFNTTIPAGENVFFGDLQVANKPSQQKWTVRDLKAHLYNAGSPGQNAGWEYIWFVPKIVEVEEENFRRKYIVYELERSDTAPLAGSQKAIGLSIRLDDEANPSPPRRLE